MNKEDRIRMAIEAGWDLHQATCDTRIKEFAALVASAEREEWEHKYARLQSLMDIRETQPNKPCCLAEREACAKVCEEGIANADDWNSAHWDQACENRAWAIRARGDT